MRGSEGGRGYMDRLWMRWRWKDHDICTSLIKCDGDLDWNLASLLSEDCSLTRTIYTTVHK